MVTFKELGASVVTSKGLSALVEAVKGVERFCRGCYYPGQVEGVPEISDLIRG